VENEEVVCIFSSVGQTKKLVGIIE